MQLQIHIVEIHTVTLTLGYSDGPIRHFHTVALSSPRPQYICVEYVEFTAPASSLRPGESEERK